MFYYFINLKFINLFIFFYFKNRLQLIKKKFIYLYFNYSNYQNKNFLNLLNFKKFLKLLRYVLFIIGIK
jgi:hypothetical protein